MKISVKNIQGTIIRDNERYTVEDNYELNNLTVSKTTLHPKQETTGHAHEAVEEVYIFLDGQGTVQVGDEKYIVIADSIILVPEGAFHKVYNTGHVDLIFLSIFQTYERKNPKD